MAKEEKPMIELERTYNVPLRREFIKVAKWKRTRKASKALKEFLIKHMKSENVKIGKYLNLEIWKHGGKNPPHHVKVIATKDSEGLVKAELEGAPKEVSKEDKKDKKKKAKEAKKKEEEKKPSEEEKAKPEENIGEKVPKDEKVETKPEAAEKEKVAEIAKEIMQKGSAK